MITGAILRIGSTSCDILRIYADVFMCVAFRGTVGSRVLVVVAFRRSITHDVDLIRKIALIIGGMRPLA